MKKTLDIILGVLVACGIFVFNSDLNVVHADENTVVSNENYKVSDIKNLDNSDLAEDEKSALSDFLNNYVNKDITVKDASFSTATFFQDTEPESFLDFTNIPRIKKYIVKDTSNSGLESKLSGMTFEVGRVDHYAISDGNLSIFTKAGQGNSVLADGLGLAVYYNGQYVKGNISR